ncbi:hypothetical protein HMPREF0373_03159 [Eubacterium ramulus ATCC 29099]|uniref:Uncharacterized protein n=1 Tax=Eubacterium ramulus ATCC 29099 TaxID=1256908 RepID=U2QSD6_EUBRA|nr:hypothetical protein HMPREF0373_03159 [Eubacterium ramulus ATCC 29099]
MLLFDRKFNVISYQIKSGQPTLPARLLFIFLTSAGYQSSVTDQIFNRNC